MALNLDWGSVSEHFKTDGEVSYWKVLGGIAGCVILPEVAFVAGAVVATATAKEAIVSRIEKRSYERGVEDATAKHAAKYEKLRAAYEKTVSKFKEQLDYFNLILALYTVGMACAACDGEVSPEEQRDIEEFISGLATAKLPDDVREKIDEIRANPQNIETTFAYVKSLNLDCWDLIDEVIELVISSDDQVKDAETVFCAQWALLKIA